MRNEKMVTLLSSLILFSQVILPIIVTADLSDETSLSEHNTIDIAANNQFTVANGMVAGNGTSGNPYIIENWTIDATDDHGIHIKDTTAYFIIRNCYIYNGTNGTGYYAIYIDNVQNGRVENNRFSNNAHGFYIDSSKNNEFHNNLIQNCTWGIWIEWDSDNLLFVDNRVENSSYGFVLDRSTNNTLYNTTMVDCNHSFYVHSNWGVFHNTHFYHTIPTNNTIDGRPIYYYVNKSDITVPLNAAFVGLIDCDNMTAKDMVLINTGYGIMVVNTTNSSIINISIDLAEIAIIMVASSNNSFIGNDLRATDSQEDAMQIRLNSEYNLISNNTIHGSGDGIVLWGDSNFNHIFNNSIFSNKHRGLNMANVESNKIFNNSFYDNDDSIRLYHGCYRNEIFNNTINDSDIGIFFDYGNHDNIVRNNEVFNNTDGIRLHGPGGLIKRNTIIGNLVHNNSQDGIHLFIGENNTISDNIVRDNSAKGIYLIHGGKNKVINNTVLNNSIYGIFIQQTQKNILYNNTISGHPYNFGISGPDIFVYNHTITSNNTVDGKPIYYYVNDNDKDVPLDAGYVGFVYCNNMTGSNLMISNNSQGVLLIDSSTSILFNNSVSYTQNGIFSFDSTTNEISNNTFQNNSINGILLKGGSDSNTITNNTIINNSRGLELQQSDDNLVYNNYFNNSNNVLISSSNGNKWNISKTQITNIIGGEYQGGNYWSDYEGFDCDTDGIGDTDVPHGPGDSLPIVYPLTHESILPEIIDKTIGQPTTGDPFSIDVTINDNLFVANATIEYWFDGGPHTNISMDYLSGNNTEKNYSKTIAIPSTAFDFSYFISGKDISDNWNSTVITAIHILDNDRPLITSNPGIPTTGDPFEFNSTVTDNINVSTVKCEYWFDAGSSKNISLNLSTGYYNSTILVKANATILHYIISASDNSSNWNATRIDVNVLDNDKPIVTDNTNGIPTTNDTYNINVSVEDNINISSVNFEYWSNDDAHTNTSVDIVGDYYTKDILVNYNATVLHYIISVNDSSDNWNVLSTTDLLVTDNDAPLIIDTTSGTPTTGDEFILTWTLNENIELFEVRIEYWFNQDEHDNLTVVENDGFFHTTTIPSNAITMGYIISAIDSSSNIGILRQLIVHVVDNDLPSVIDNTDLPETGADLMISCEATDNIGMDGVDLEYQFDGGSIILTEMIDNGSFEFKVEIPLTAHILHYSFYAYDTSGNVFIISHEQNIKDISKPNITDQSDFPTTGDTFELILDVNDNWEVSKITVEYWFDNSTSNNVTYVDLLEIDVPSGSSVLYIIIVALDASGNIGILQLEKRVIDNDKPTIEDQSAEVATTGEIFDFDLKITDNIGVKEIYIEYRFQDDPSVKVYYPETNNVSIPNDAIKFEYKVGVFDTANNLIEIMKVIYVTDNDPPEIIDATEIPETGQKSKIGANITENIGLNNSWVEYWFDDGVHVSKDMFPSFEGYYINIDIPEEAGTLHYIISSSDTSSNIMELRRTLEVYDVIPPLITDQSKGEVETGALYIIIFSVKENIKVGSTSIEYSYNDGDHTIIQDQYETRIMTPMNVTMMCYQIKAIDTSGNEDSVNKCLDVQDVLDPKLEDLTKGTPKAFWKYTFTVRANDNIKISKVNLVYKAGGTYKTVEMEKDDGLYTKDIRLGDIEELEYKIVCIDSSGNTVETDVRSVDVESGMNMMVILASLIGIILIILIIFVIIWKRKRKSP